MWCLSEIEEPHRGDLLNVVCLSEIEEPHRGVLPNVVSE